MVSELATEPPSIRQDGFGTRIIEQSEKHGRYERLQLSPGLATPMSEQAIRARAAHLTSLGPGPVGRVAQLGALVLAISLRRSLRREESPQRIGDLVTATTIGSSAKMHSRLRTWLQDTMQTPGPVVFDSCIDAARKFDRVLPKDAVTRQAPWRSEPRFCSLPQFLSFRTDRSLIPCPQMRGGSRLVRGVWADSRSF